MKTRPAPVLPVTKDELEENEFAFELIQLTDTGEFTGIRSGRWRFFAYWLDDYLPPNGVRGQVYDTWIEEWINDRLNQGKKVTALQDSGQTILQLVITGRQQAGLDNTPEV